MSKTLEDVFREAAPQNWAENEIGELAHYSHILAREVTTLKAEIRALQSQIVDLNLCLEIFAGKQK